MMLSREYFLVQLYRKFLPFFEYLKNDLVLYVLNAIKIYELLK